MVTTEYSRPGGAPDPARHFLALTAVSLALLLVSLGATVIDGRTVAGVGVWLKPVKFALSFMVLFATLAFATGRLSARFRGSYAITLSLLACMAAFGFEMAYMMVQAGRAEASHFNDSTPFHAAMYALMGVGALALVAAIAAIGWSVLRDHAARFDPGLRAGIVGGFLSTTVLTLIVAGYMSNSGGHFVGAPGDGAATIPLLGWSAEVGDLRPAHFAALHAMQALPLLGWMLDRRGVARPEHWMVVSTVAWAALTLALFAQALAGRPLFAL